jgi:hypothetical protein
MKLATASRVLLSMSIVENVGSLASAGQALDLSTPLLENLLETTFGAESRTDYFDVISGELCFRATNRFLLKETVVVRLSTDGLPLTSPTMGEIQDPSTYSLDPDLGTITFRGAIRTGTCMLSVAYTSGFEVGYDDLTVYNDVPEWLQACAVATAVHVQNTFPSSPANRKGASVSAVSNEIRGIASHLVNSRMRPRMTATFPSSSSVNE